MRRDSESKYYRLALAGALLGLAVLVAVRAGVLLEGTIGFAGRYGYTPNPAGTREFLEELERPRFAQAAPECMAKASGVDTFLYRAADKAHRARYGTPFKVWRQSIGDCVSFGWGLGIFVSQSVDWQNGQLEEPPLLPATEAIYGGSRVCARNKPGDGSSPVGGWSDGSYGGAAARWCRDWGVVYREEVGGHDLRVYSGDRAKQWGAYGNGGKGDGGKLDAIAKRHPCKYVSLTKTWDEAAAAIEAGFAIPICSMQGFASTRSEGGWSAASGTWAHCLCLIGVRYQRNGSPRDGMLVANSWGESWISGPRWPEDMPEGCFWADRKTIERMLSGEDSFAVGSVAGWGWRELHHGEWLQPLPVETLGRRPQPARLITDVFHIGL
jgi:hypothetical protein